MTEEQQRDYDKYYVKNPGDFSPEYNDMVIARTIKKTDDFRKKKAKKFEEEMAERTEAVATYLTSMVGSRVPLERYFGKREMARLRAEKIVKIVRNGMVYLEEID